MKAQSFAALAAFAFTFVSAVTGYTVADPWGQCSEETVCPEGYFCQVVNEQYSHCVTEDQVDKPTHGLFKRQSGFTPITGPVNAGVVNRLPVQQLQSQQPDVFNMFLWSLWVIMNVAETNSLSYYQMSGIHGRPFIPWQEPTSPSQDSSTGYCTHDSALFATWHRPYLSLFEQRLTAHAINEASKFRGSDATRWQNAARQVRLPYWDWSSSTSARPSLASSANLR